MLLPENTSKRDSSREQLRITRTSRTTSRSERPHRLILCNDGGTLQGLTKEAPIGAQGLADATIGPLVDTQVDTLYWQLGTDPGIATPSHRLSDVYSHDTRIGPRFGADGARFDSAGSWRMYENTSSLLAQDTDPAAVVIEHGQRAGLEVFLSFRVNDIHDGSLPGPGTPCSRRASGTIRIGCSAGQQAAAGRMPASPGSPTTLASRGA